MHPPRLARSEAAEFLLGLLDLWQHLVRKAQQARACRRQFQRLGPAHEQFDAGLFFQTLHLMRQGRLGHVQQVRGTGQPARLLNGADGAQVFQLDMHIRISS